MEQVKAVESALLLAMGSEEESARYLGQGLVLEKAKLMAVSSD